MKNQKFDYTRSIAAVLAYPIVLFLALLVFLPVFGGTSIDTIRAVSAFLIVGGMFLFPPIATGVIAPKKPGIHAFLAAMLLYLGMHLVFLPYFKHYVDVNNIGTSFNFARASLTLPRLGAVVILSLFSGCIGYISAKARDRIQR